LKSVIGFELRLKNQVVELFGFVEQAILLVFRATSVWVRNW
jgi:hypothetical protein